MKKGAKWSDLLDRAIQVAIDKFLNNFENKSATYTKHKSSFDQYARTSTKSELKSKFANNLLVLTAAVMKADGILCGFPEGELVAKYAHQNKGQQRMNAGNRIRSAVKKETATVEQLAKAMA